MQNIYLHDFKISGHPRDPGGGRRHTRSTRDGAKSPKVGIDRLIVLNMATGCGIRLEGLNGNDEAIVLVSMRDTACSFCRRLSAKFVFNADLQNCNLRQTTPLAFLL
jgi:hypothetical protein